MSVASWSRQYFAVVEVGKNQLGTPPGSDLENNLPNLLSSPMPTFGVDEIGMEGNGVDGGKHKLLLTSKPAILPNTAVQDDRKTTGTPDPSEKDIEITIADPSETDLEMNMSAYAINMGLLILFQQGSTQQYVPSLDPDLLVYFEDASDSETNLHLAGYANQDKFPKSGYIYVTDTHEIIKYTDIDIGDNLIGVERGALGTIAAPLTMTDTGSSALVETTFRPYDTAEALYYLALVEKVRKLYGANPYDESVMARGTIARTFNLEFDEGGVAKGTIGVLFAKWQNDFDAQPVNSPASTAASLKWQNAFVYFMDWDAVPDTATHKVWLQSLSLNGTNNASSHFYNSEEVKNFTLNDIVFTGSLSIPWVANAERAEYYWEQINAFKEGRKKRLIVGWGYEGATDLSELGQVDNGFMIDMYIQYSGAGREGDDIILSNMEFKNILPEGRPYSVVFKTFTDVARLDRGLPKTV